jgi:valyl-tRNA synthetase
MLQITLAQSPAVFFCIPILDNIFAPHIMQRRHHQRSGRFHRLQLEGRLANEKYVAQAPKKIVDQTREELETLTELEQRLGRELEVL